MSNDGPNALDGDEITERVERFDEGVSITAKIKRGTGTRDQDTLTGKVKRRSLADAREEMDELTEELKQRAEELREIQPGDEGE